jgi:hypothetical protein
MRVILAGRKQLSSAHFRREKSGDSTSAAPYPVDGY